MSPRIDCSWIRELRTTLVPENIEKFPFSSRRARAGNSREPNAGFMTLTMQNRRTQMTRLDKSECARLMELTSALCSIDALEQLQPTVLNCLQNLIPHELGACHRMQPERHEIAAFYEPLRRP